MNFVEEENILELNRVVMAFGGLMALSNLNFQVKKGKSHAFARMPATNGSSSRTRAIAPDWLAAAAAACERRSRRANEEECMRWVDWCVLIDVGSFDGGFIVADFCPFLVDGYLTILDKGDVGGCAPDINH